MKLAERRSTSLTKESDWGFASFMLLSELYDPNKEYLINDKVVIEVDVVIRK
ncbi:CSN-associated deubiquitinating enzyme Ubp12, partial [Datura stramonium]|nr:CSN-associated deubiquitinating enzyme Ubp12 [Datura stramonium]